MTDLSSDSLKKGPGLHDNPAYIASSDAVEIVFNDGSKIEGRTPGKPYVVNSGLAHHYCEVLKVAQRVEPAPPTMTDRAVAPPPRGKAREKE